MFDDLSDGIKEAKKGNTKLGLELLKDFETSKDFPKEKAWFGYCLAYEKKDTAAGISLCKTALSCNSQLPDVYLALARIYLLNGQRKFAIDTLQKGLKTKGNGEILSLLRLLGMRKNPIIPFLSRDHFINISLGRFMSSIGLRR